MRSECLPDPVELDDFPGEIFSPGLIPLAGGGYLGSIPARTFCKWKVSAPEGKVIEVASKFFELNDSPQCSSARLSFYDGESASGSLLGRFCGNRSVNIRSRAQNLLLSLVNREGNISTGFHLSYKMTDGADEMAKGRNLAMLLIAAIVLLFLLYILYRSCRQHFKKRSRSPDPEAAATRPRAIATTQRDAVSRSSRDLLNRGDDDDGGDPETRPGALIAPPSYEDVLQEDQRINELLAPTDAAGRAQQTPSYEEAIRAKRTAKINRNTL